MSFGGEIKKGDRMSPREEEVYRYLAAAIMNKQIAWELGVGEATVKALVSAVFRKTGTCTRSQVVLIAHGFSLADELARARAARINRHPAPLALPTPAAGVEA